MNKIALLSIVTLMLGSCIESNKETSENITTTTNEIIGTWKLVYGEIREDDSLEIKDMSKSEFIKIINKDHFAFFNQNHTDSKAFYGGGGTYTLEGNNYTETLDFTSADAVRGHSFPFTVEFKGDTLIQFGLEEVKEANIKRNIIEKYVRLIE